MQDYSMALLLIRRKFWKIVVNMGLARKDRLYQSQVRWRLSTVR